MGFVFLPIANHGLRCLIVLYVGKHRMTENLIEQDRCEKNLLECRQHSSCQVYRRFHSFP